MAKKERTVRYSAEELAEMRRRGETRSDWARAGATTDAEIEAQAAADPDEAGLDIDWRTVSVELPKAKAAVHMRIDRDVLDFFRSTGKGYQTRINAVLKSYVEKMRRPG
ncbi:MAG TPA: BrnA antitoxin family protein [Stellaceae bacterium]|nr:BrnA antitoxin family protein [Stellaceae bacterium]